MLSHILLFLYKVAFSALAGLGRAAGDYGKVSAGIGMTMKALSVI